MILHLNGAGPLFEIKKHVVRKMSKGDRCLVTYTTTPASTQSLALGRTTLPSLSTGGSMSAAQRIVAIAMNKAWLAKCKPTHELINGECDSDSIVC